ncbi:MAG: tetratricopeptide repeat protein [Hormoscilla sp. GUM202]|nr:tetratricopeptide repeat protein [Hormoscilla sp. GUM202]
MQYLLIYAIAIFLLWKVIAFRVIFWQFSKMAIQYGKYESKEIKEFPGHLKQLFKHPVLELKQLGFKGCCCLHIEGMSSLNMSKEWGVLLYNQEFKTYAIVKNNLLAEPFDWFNIKFFSFFKDKTLLLTTNGEAHGIIDQIPNSIVEDPYTALTEVHWQAHRDKFEQLVGSKQPCDLAPITFLKALEICEKIYIDRLVNLGKILPIKGTKKIKFSFLMVRKEAIKFETNKRLLQKLNKERQELFQTDPTIEVDIPVEIEVENFLWMQQLERDYVKRKMAGPILVGSLVLFAISFISLLDWVSFLHLQFLLILIGVIFLHEAGHFLAMKCFGYQDKSIFFIPFFGAAATGHKEEATLTEKVWVLLAGPLPGLVMGIGLAIAIYGKFQFPVWLATASGMLIGINLFNLLPIYPLDGGKVADLLLFSRYPYTDVMFKLFTVVMLVLLGMEYPILLFIAVGVGLTIPLSFKTAEIDVKLRKELLQLSSVDKESILHLIYKTIKQSRYGKQDFAQRYQLAKNMLQRHQQARSKWTTRVLLIALYCASLLGGLAGTIRAMGPQWKRYITAIENPAKFPETIIGTIIETIIDEQIESANQAFIQEKIESANQALQQNPNDVSAYFKRAQANRMLQDYESAIADLDRAIQLDPNSTKAYQMRSAVRRQMGDEQGAKEDDLKANASIAAPILDRANQALQQNPKDANAYLERARAKMILQDYEEAIADIDRAIQQNPKDANAYLERAHANMMLQDYEGAIADIDRAIQQNPKDANAYLERASVNMELQDYESAIADASEAIELKPNFAEAYWLRSEARRELGDEEGAHADEQKAQDLEASQW